MDCSIREARLLHFAGDGPIESRVPPLSQELQNNDSVVEQARKDGALYHESVKKGFFDAIRKTGNDDNAIRANLVANYLGMPALSQMKVTRITDHVVNTRQGQVYSITGRPLRSYMVITSPSGRALGALLFDPHVNALWFVNTDWQIISRSTFQQALEKSVKAEQARAKETKSKAEDARNVSSLEREINAIDKRNSDAISGIR